MNIYPATKCREEIVRINLERYGSPDHPWPNKGSLTELFVPTTMDEAFWLGRDYGASPVQLAVPWDLNPEVVRHWIPPQMGTTLLHWRVAHEPLRGNTGGAGPLNLVLTLPPYNNPFFSGIRVTLGCQHSHMSTKIANCWYRYVCVKCGNEYEVDSSG